MRPVVQRKILAAFRAPAGMTEVNGRFILFCVKMDRAHVAEQQAAWKKDGSGGWEGCGDSRHGGKAEDDWEWWKEFNQPQSSIPAAFARPSTEVAPWGPGQRQARFPSQSPSAPSEIPVPKQEYYVDEP